MLRTVRAPCKHVVQATHLLGQGYNKGSTRWKTVGRYVGLCTLVDILTHTRSDMSYFGLPSVISGAHNVHCNNQG